MTHSDGRVDELLQGLRTYDVSPEAAARIRHKARREITSGGQPRSWRGYLEEAYTRFIELKLAAAVAMLYLGWALETLTALHH
jgi:hypothetical protein